MSLFETLTREMVEERLHEAFGVTRYPKWYNTYCRKARQVFNGRPSVTEHCGKLLFNAHHNKFQTMAIPTDWDDRVYPLASNTNSNWYVIDLKDIIRESKYGTLYRCSATRIVKGCSITVQDVYCVVTGLDRQAYVSNSIPAAVQGARKIVEQQFVKKYMGV